MRAPEERKPWLVRRVSLFATAVALALVATPPLADPFKLKIACTATSDCASAMVARDRGIFAKHGLDADVTLIGINTNIPPGDRVGFDPDRRSDFASLPSGCRRRARPCGGRRRFGHGPGGEQNHRRRRAHGRFDQGAERFRRQKGRRARHRRLSARAFPQMAD